MSNLINKKETVTAVGYTDFSGFSKVNPVDVSTVLLNFTWTLFLIIVAGGITYFGWEVIKQMREKRLRDGEIYDQIIKYDTSINKLSNDLDNLGKKIRNLEQRK